MRKRIVVGVSGATGVIYAICLLEHLKKFEQIETHLILSKWAKENIAIETDYSVETVEALADVLYDYEDVSGAIASGSFPAHGMVILPCSMKTLSAIANGFSDNLLTRAADVFIKESRPLVICPRESPLSAVHLENMLKLSRLGVKILPPMPGFYYRPQSLMDIVNHTCMRILDQFQLDTGFAGRWWGK